MTNLLEALFGNTLGAEFDAADKRQRERNGNEHQVDVGEWLVALPGQKKIKFVYGDYFPGKIPMEGVMVGVGLGRTYHEVLRRRLSLDLPPSSSMVQMIAEASGHSLVPLLKEVVSGIYLGVQLNGTQNAPGNTGAIETVRYVCQDQARALITLQESLKIVNKQLSR